MRELKPKQLGKIVGILTHDLRNPLAALVSNAGFLSRRAQLFPADVREALHDLGLSVESLIRLVDILEVLSQDLQELPPVAPQVCSVGELVGSVWPVALRAARSREVELIADCQEVERVYVEREEFQRALSSLLDRAIRHAAPQAQVVLSTYATAQSVHFVMRDVGLSPSAFVQEASAQAALSFREKARESTPQAEAREQEEKAHSSGGQLWKLGGEEMFSSRGLSLYMVGRCSERAGAEVRWTPSHPHRIEIVATRVATELS